jgi:hypothetical protein
MHMLFSKNKCDLYVCVCIRACNTRERLSFLKTFCIHTFLCHGSACVDFMFRHVSALMLVSATFRRCSLIVIALLCVHYASTHNRGVVAAMTRRRAFSTATSAGASCSGHARSLQSPRRATRCSAVCVPMGKRLRRLRLWRAAAAFSNWLQHRGVVTAWGNGLDGRSMLLFDGAMVHSFCRLQDEQWLHGVALRTRCLQIFHCSSSKKLCVAPTYAQHLINEISFGETTKARCRRRPAINIIKYT